MDLNSPDDDHWSETESSSDEEANGPITIQSRAYQIEMFERSLQGNTIAVVG